MIKGIQGGEDNQAFGLTILRAYADLIFDEDHAGKIIK
jgi:hypothetical protein